MAPCKGGPAWAIPQNALFACVLRPIPDLFASKGAFFVECSFAFLASSLFICSLPLSGRLFPVVCRGTWANPVGEPRLLDYARWGRAAGMDEQIALRYPEPPCGRARERTISLPARRQLRDRGTGAWQSL